nr:retrovirus-related Pol polyprotein from transposon TNT 1-94 [Tanacetum cinerariifolium]
MPNVDTTNTSPTINVSRSVVNDDLFLPQLLDSRGGFHITNVPTFDKDDFTRQSDIRDTKIAALRLKFNAFKALEGEKVNGTYTRLKCLLNDLKNNGVIISQSEWIDELTKEKNDKGKGDKEKSDKGLVAESFDWDDESMSSEDEGTTKFKAFMAIAEDELPVGKEDARYGQWVDINMKKIHRLLSMTDNEERKHVLDYTHVDLQYVENQRNNLVNKFNALKLDLALHKPELCNLKNTTCSKVTLDQLLSEQIPGNIVKTFEGKGRRKENNSKEVLFTKVDVSTSESAHMITSDSEDDSNNQKKTKPKHLAVQNSCPDKNALPSTEQLLLTLMEEVKEDSLILNIKDVVPSLDEAVHPKPVATFESSNLQEDDIDEPIDDHPLLQVNSPLVDSGSGPLAPQDRWSREKHIDLVNVIGEPLVAKAFRVFNTRRQEMEETFHVTFSEDDEAISQTSIEGDAINFNEVNSFPDDEFTEAEYVASAG